MPCSRWIILGTALALTSAPTVGRAQNLVSPAGRKPTKVQIPKEYLPPAGLCRIWIDDVPAAQQPAPTDCPTAIKNKPTNGHVVFGDETSDRDRSKSAKGKADKGKSRKPE